MINILQTEFFRLKKNVLFWSLMAVCAILPFVSVLLQLLGISLINNIGADVSYDFGEYLKSLNLPIVALSDLPNFSDHALFALICTSIFLSAEFSGGTFRNALLANRSRTQLYFSYLIVSVTIGATYLGVAFVSTLLFNGAIFGFASMPAAKVIAACLIALVMGLFSMAFLQTMMCMFLFSARKLSVALACPLVICILAPSLLYTFVTLFTGIGAISTVNSSWIPLYNINLLDLTHLDGALIGKILLYLIPLTALFGFVGWYSFQKADLK